MKVHANAPLGPKGRLTMVLRVLEDGLIMKSEANLIVSRTADWTPLRKAQLEALLSIMGGVPPGISTLL